MAAFILSSCNEKNFLEGTYRTKYILKNGFSEIEGNDRVDLFLNVEQKIKYEFSSDGNYTKTVEQALKSIENISNIVLPKTEEEIAKEIDNSLTILGTYYTKKDKIHFSAYEIILADGTHFNYDDYREIQGFIDDGETDETFSFDAENNEITISEIYYEKVAAGK